MPRLFHRPPKYGLHKSTKQAIVCHQGKLIFLGPHGSEKSHRRYNEFLEQWYVWRHQQVPSQKKKATQADRVEEMVTPVYLRLKHRQGLTVTIDELIYVYRKHAREYYVKNGQATREAELIVEITELFGPKYGSGSSNEFGSVELETFRETLVDNYDWTRKFINKQINRLILMFKWGARKEICLPKVYQQLETLGGLKKGRTRARDNPEVTCVDEGHFEKTLPHVPPVIADMARFQILTGARPGEVCTIRPCDIDRTNSVWIYRPDGHKTQHHEKDRLIPIGPAAQEVLRPYLDRPKRCFCFSPQESVEAMRRVGSAARKTPLSCGNKRRIKHKNLKLNGPSDCYQVCSYRGAVRRGCKRAGVPVWTPNQLRHNAATKVRKKHGLEAAQVMLGHANANVTQVYAERDLELAMKAAEDLG